MNSGIASHNNEPHRTEAIMNNVTTDTPARRTFAVIEGGLNAKVSSEAPPALHQPKLLDQVRQAICMRHYSYRTEKAYAHWIKRYILFHHKRHPVEMGEAEISRFLSSLAIDSHVSASTQNQACSSISLQAGAEQETRIDRGRRAGEADETAAGRTYKRRSQSCDRLHSRRAPVDRNAALWWRFATDGVLSPQG
jgi:hypothetical protein